MDMFVDYVKIFIKAGNGGNGKISYRHEMYIPNAGVDGGTGGNGANVVFVADKSIDTLLDFKFKKHFRAEDGQPGGSKNCTGKSGEDLIIPVPVGTIIRETETGNILADMFEDGERYIALKGGRGGLGNASFAHSKRQAPEFAQLGEKTKEHQVTLELKTIADVGLVGLPNVGKSTLLSVLTSARPKIANYHFTTLNPNLGVVEMYDDNFVIADIPGLIEGASEGQGLGHYFLRHIERVRLIVHVLDVSGSEGRDPVEDYKVINEELKKHSEKLAEIPQIVVGTKIDLMENPDDIKRIEKAIGQKIYPICSIMREGLDDLLKVMKAKVDELPPPKREEYDENYKLDKESDLKFTVSILDDGTYFVDGGLVDYLIQSVVVSNEESFAFFQKVLKDHGVIDELKKQGMKEGDIVSIGDLEFEWVD